jgi:hypothetical protein
MLASGRHGRAACTLATYDPGNPRWETAGGSVAERTLATVAGWMKSSHA